MPVGDAGKEGPLLLYVEDNAMNLRLMEEIVKFRGNFRLVTATNGAEGIEAAREHCPDVILMDLHLPGIDGFSAFQILRADPRTAHIPVIALSASAMPGEIQKGLAAGFFSYVTKPIDLDNFYREVERALAKER